ncbi:hypothetical protein HFP15_25465 [Amycolatopsis sp. K13G38]|uniref:Uncharacterized protein n=1 Tax=Amycolatopsis acididurans TaxID=2724524 RepID=A0ABX1JAB3_9PSEU|nr:hypothetical protein [Amycolatopsis acididurans]NKQ56231.1 hypothetical protein [Amycolatopsis acididurans]
MWAAICLETADYDAAGTVEWAVRQRLADQSEEAARLYTVRLDQPDWLQACWRIRAESDERAALWALHALRSAATAACRHAGRNTERVDVAPVFSLTVEPEPAKR